MFELVEASLNQVAFFVGTTIVAVFALPVGSGRDHHLHAFGADQFAKLTAIVAFVGDDRFSFHAFNKLRRTVDVVGLTRRKQEAQWSAFAVGDQMDLGS